MVPASREVKPVAPASQNRWHQLCEASSTGIDAGGTGFAGSPSFQGLYMKKLWFIPLTEGKGWYLLHKHLLTEQSKGEFAYFLSIKFSIPTMTYLCHSWGVPPMSGQDLRNVSPVIVCIKLCVHMLYCDSVVSIWSRF